MKFLFSVLLLLSVVVLRGQDTLFADQLQGVQEKVYVQTDRSAYSAGETLWFSVYRMDAFTHNRDVYSKYVYVELLDPHNVVVKRVKVMEIDSFFYGNIGLPPKLETGEYCLRAYTNWMQNYDPDFFFRKTIRITKVQEPEIISTIAYEAGLDSMVYAQIRLFDENGSPLSVRMEYELRDKDRGLIEKRSVATDRGGQMTIPFHSGKNVRYITVRHVLKRLVKYKHTFDVPLFDKEFDVQFFPEGGYLAAHMRQCVAFKAIANNGLSVEIEGEVTDDTGEVVASFKSTRKGMGKFEFTPQSGRVYYAFVKTPDGLQKQIRLVKPLDNAVHIEVCRKDEQVGCKVVAGQNFTYPPGFGLLLNCRGVLTDYIQLGRDTTLWFAADKFPAGINQFLLLDKNFQPYGSRLFFVYPAHLPAAVVTMDKERYGKREWVDVSINICDTGMLLPDYARVSVAVTDDGQCKEGPYVPHIITDLLLTSDIKGYVEQPGYYFDTAIALEQRERELDLLMLTQGWKRFDPVKYVRQEYPVCDYGLELTQRITGGVKNLFGKPPKQVKINIFASDIKLFRLQNVDTNGRFTIDNLTFPDSTVISINSFTKKGGRVNEIWVDNPEFVFVPERVQQPYYLLRSGEKSVFNASMSAEYDSLFDPVKYAYYDYGGKVYMMREVVVKGKVERRFAKNASAPGVPNQYGEYIVEGFDKDDILNGEFKTIDHMLNAIPGVVSDIPFSGSYLPQRRVYFIGYPKAASVCLVDNKQIPFYNLNDISLDNILTVGVALIGKGKGYSNELAVVVYLKPYKERSHSNLIPNKINVCPLGYLKAAEFYVPKYGLECEKDTEPDERKTIYWNPRLKVGKDLCRVGFYTSDAADSYTLTLEGITADGMPVRVQKTIKRK